MVDDQATDGLEVTLRQVDAERPLHLVDVDVALHDPDPVLGDGRVGRLFRVVLVGDLPDDLLGQVLHREDPGEAAVLVDDAGELLAVLVELAQRVGQAHQLGHDEGLAHDVRAGGVVSPSVREHVDEVHDPDDVVLVPDDRVARVPRAHLLANLRDRGLRAQGVDLRTRDHRVGHVLAGEVQDAVHHDRQLVRQVAALARQLDDVLQVPRRGGVLHVVDRLDAQQAQQQLGRLVKDPDDRSEDGEVDRGGPRQPPGHLVGAGDRVVLGEQLSEEHLHHGREDERDDRPDGDRQSHRYTSVAEHDADGLADQRLGHVADEQPGDGDAQLGTGQHERGAAGDLEGLAGELVTVAVPRPEPGPVHRHERELLRHEIPRGCRDQQHDHQADDEGQHRAHRTAPSCSGPREAVSGLQGSSGWRGCMGLSGGWGEGAGRWDNARLALGVPGRRGRAVGMSYPTATDGSRHGGGRRHTAEGHRAGWRCALRPGGGAARSARAPPRGSPGCATSAAARPDRAAGRVGAHRSLRTVGRRQPPSAAPARVASTA